MVPEALSLQRSAVAVVTLHSDFPASTQHGRGELARQRHHIPAIILTVVGVSEVRHGLLFV